MTRSTRSSDVERMLGDEDDVRLPVRGAERDVAGVPAHDLDDGDAPMALGGRADALDALRRHQDRRGVTRRGVVDDLIEIEDRARRRALVAVARRAAGILDARPFVGLARIVEAQIVVDRFRGEHRRQAFDERLEAVERAVAADGNQPLDAEPRETRRDAVDLRLLVRVDVVPRRADERAALGRIELRDFLEQRVQVKVRHARVEEAVEALDEPVDLNPKLVGADHRPMDRRVERRRIAAGGQDADAFHRLSV